jgi:tRNA U55 pseudouridine synthase TruB
MLLHIQAYRADLFKSEQIHFQSSADKIGQIKQNYPPYSSKTVNGKPLWQWAREGKVSEIEIPKHEIFIKNIEILNEFKITGKDLLEKIKKDIDGSGMAVYKSYMS